MSSSKFGEFVRLKRESKGVRGTFVCKEAGITRGSLYNIEYGINDPKLGTAIDLLNAVGESLESFASYLEQEKNKLTQLELTHKKLKNYSTQLPCLVCGNVMEGGNTFHHIITQKNLGPDEEWNLMPLCTFHHNEIHSSGRTTFVGNYQPVREWMIDHQWDFSEQFNKWSRPC